MHKHTSASLKAQQLEIANTGNKLQGTLWRRDPGIDHASNISLTGHCPHQARRGAGQVREEVGHRRFLKEGRTWAGPRAPYPLLSSLASLQDFEEQSS